MIKNTLSVLGLTALFLALASPIVHAEEPFIGVGVVSHSYEQDQGGFSDFEAKPSSYRLTLGSRISKNYLIEAYYLEANESDTVTLGPLPNSLEIEYGTTVGASINRTFIAGPLTFYIGPNVTAAKIETETSTGNPAQDAALNALNDKDTRISPGLGAGIDFRLYKKISINVNAQSYYADNDILGYGAGAELRYHF